jgi:hypothetical protein
MKVYLSGPISGKPNNNREAFRKRGEEILKECGTDLIIVNPLDIGVGVEYCFAESNKLKPEWEDYMRSDIIELMKCSCVYLMEGWECSRGAKIEQFLALTLNIPCEETIDGLKRTIEVIKRKERDGN